MKFSFPDISFPKIKSSGWGWAPWPVRTSEPVRAPEPEPEEPEPEPELASELAPAVTVLTGGVGQDVFTVTDGFVGTIAAGDAGFGDRDYFEWDITGTNIILKTDGWLGSIVASPVSGTTSFFNPNNSDWVTFYAWRDPFQNEAEAYAALANEPYRQDAMDYYAVIVTGADYDAHLKIMKINAPGTDHAVTTGDISTLIDIGVTGMTTNDIYKMDIYLV